MSISAACKLMNENNTLALSVENELNHLMNLISQGCQTSLRELYNLTNRRLLAIILHTNSHQGQAEEVLQETYLKIWRDAKLYNALKGNVRAWLSKIARNTAIDSMRKNASRPIFETPDHGEEADAYSRLVSPLPGPLEALLLSDQGRYLNECLDRLHPEHRLVLSLSFYDGLTHSEIAKLIGRPLGSVKTWIRRALIHLKSTLDSDFQTTQTI